MRINLILQFGNCSLSALFSHMTKLHGSPSPLILKTFAPKKSPCSYGVKYYWPLPRPLRMPPEESGQATPCILYLYSTILYSRVSNPCCCNKHKGALTDGLTLSIPPEWLSDARLWTKQQQNKYTHQIRGALNCLKTICTWRGTVVWCCLRNSSRDNRTYLVQGKFSYWNITWLRQRPSITFPLHAPETSPFCFQCPCASDTKRSLHT